MPGIDILGRRALFAQGRNVVVRILNLEEGLRSDGNALVLRLSLPGQQAEEETGKEKRQSKPKA